MRRIESAALAAITAAGLLTGCGASAGISGEHTGGTEAAVQEDNGTVLNIQCWNDEIRELFEKYYPGYERVDDTTGKLGDVTVKFIVTSTEDNAYRTNLDTALAGNASAAPEDKVDLFLTDADSVQNDTRTDGFAMKLSELGITEDDLSDQYSYIREAASDTDGELRGAAWEACAGGLIYNREIAQSVLGTDDPEEVQEAVKDWDSFAETAEKLRKAGYQITATANDTYRAYAANKAKAWVSEDGMLQIDDSLKEWAESAKALVDAKETGTAAIWSEDWSAGFYEETPVFAYFGPLWFVTSSMCEGEDGSVADNGGWAMTEGPQGFSWGGTWICAAEGTDNPTLVKEVILTLTANAEVQKEMASAGISVNNSSVMNELADDDTIGVDALGGQNPFRVLSANAETITASKRSVYDAGCDEAFRSAMKTYFDGNATYEEAVESFQKNIAEKYPELSVE